MRVRTPSRATKTTENAQEQLALDLDAPICSCNTSNALDCEYDKKWRARDPERGERPAGCIKLQIPF